jgi:hypothetical protein
MRPCQRLHVTLATAALLASAIPAFAARPATTLRRIDAAESRLSAVPAAPTNALCALGVTDAPAWSVGYIIPGEDQYYTLVDPAECAGGDDCGVSVSLAHIVLDFSYAMSTPVRVGLVQADLTDAECPVPMPGVYVCPPVTYDIAGPDAGLYDVALPLSESATLTGKVFLEITFTEWGPYWDVPGLAITAACDPCRSYNYYPGDNYDLCTFGFDGNPVMFVDVDCANAVADEATTWGQLKASYR